MLAAKILTSFYRRVIVMVRPLDEPIPDLLPGLPAVIARLTEEDLPAYRRFRPDQPADEVQKRMARGDRCFAAWYERRIVHAAWAATGRVHVPYLRRDLILEPGEAYMHDSYTLPAYRGYGLAKAEGVYRLQHFWQEGYRRGLCVVAVENKIGFHPLEALGYRAVGLFGCLLFGPWQQDWQQAWSEEPLPVLIAAE